jgi:hypothetical protein
VFEEKESRDRTSKDATKKKKAVKARLQVRARLEVAVGLGEERC